MPRVVEQVGALVVNNADTFVQSLLAEPFRFVSPGGVSISDGRLGFSKGLRAILTGT